MTRPENELPVLMGPVTVHHLSMSPAGPGARNGLVVSGPDVEIYNVHVSGFPGDGVVLRHATSSQVRSSQIERVGGNGIVVEGGSDNYIGGPVAIPPFFWPGHENYVHSAGGSGIVIDSYGTYVFNNYIGVPPLPGWVTTPSGGHGILVRGGRQNYISQNAFMDVQDGVHVERGSAWVDANNSRNIRGRHIALGTAPPVNDSLDADEGPNRLQNHPVLETVARQGRTTVVRGSLHSEPNQEYEIRLFDRGPNCSNAVDGFNSFRVVTDEAGNATFDRVVASLSSRGSLIAATASPIWKYATSELSPCVPYGVLDGPSQADLQVRAFVLTASAAPGAEVQLLIEAANLGPSNSRPAWVTVWAREGVEVIGFRLVGWSGSCHGLGCAGPPLRPGERATLAATLRITAPVGGEAVLWAEATFDYDLDPNPMNNRVVVTLPVGSTASAVTADLDVSLRFVDPITTRPADFRALAVVRNRGTFHASNVRVEMKIEGAATTQQMWTDWCGWSSSGVCTTRLIPANESTDAWIEGTIDPTRAVIATVHVTSDAADPSITNNTARAILSAIQSVPLSWEVLLAIAAGCTAIGALRTKS